MNSVCLITSELPCYSKVLCLQSASRCTYVHVCAKVCERPSAHLCLYLCVLWVALYCSHNDCWRLGAGFEARYALRTS